MDRGSKDEKDGGKNETRGFSYRSNMGLTVMQEKEGNEVLRRDH